MKTKKEKKIVAYYAEQPLTKTDVILHGIAVIATLVAPIVALILIFK